MSQPPNFLLITTDQQRFDTIHALGNPGIFTPHLNWLAQDGWSFQRAYSDCPICVPARATIMTGRHAFESGETTNATNERSLSGNPTLPGCLTSAGYQSAGIGKMHFEPMRRRYGFEQTRLAADYYRESRRGPEPIAPLFHGLGQNEMAPAQSLVDPTRTITQWTVDQSIDFLETRDESCPFFLWSSFTKPHPPFDPPGWALDIYRSMPVPPAVFGEWSRHGPERLPSSLAGPTRALNQAWRFSPDQVAAIRRAYFACITEVDYALGRLFARLRELSLLESTWIFFTSDHGEMLCDHGLGGKAVYLEAACRVPLIIRPPAADPRSGRRRRGLIVDELACLADLLPTVLSLAGLPAPSPSSGVSLADVVDGRAQRTAVPGQCRNARVLITRDQKIIRDDDGNTFVSNPDIDPLDLELRPEPDANTSALDLPFNPRQWVQSGPFEPLLRQTDGASPLWPGFHSVANPSDVLH